MITTRFISSVVITIHVAKKYKISKYLVELYRMSMRHGQNAEGKKYGVYFISKVHEDGNLDSIPDGTRPSESKTLQQGEILREITILSWIASPTICLETLTRLLILSSR